MQLFNTLSRQKQKFEPIRPGKIGMYACGITSYDYCHIGHARSAVVFDVLARLFRHDGFDVTFVRNFTDIDDKIINRANQEGRDFKELAEFFITAFHEDMDKLKVQRADIEPRATEYIPEMLDLCARLIEKGNAYSTPSGDVYFRVRSFPDYGKLSGRDIDDLRSGARVAPGEEKEDALDFALWKSAKPGEPAWKSPWGQGRPGWHIECSAMSEKNLPLPLDIHGGGQDLIFPHHENEIAQSEAALGKDLSRYWIHNGFVQIDSEKMSKSLGNFQTIREILKSRHPESLRFFLLGKHYRSPIDFSFDAMDEAERGLKRIYECITEVKAICAKNSWKSDELPLEITREFTELKQAVYYALHDDFNTAAAIGHVFGLVRLLNRVTDDKKLSNTECTRELMQDFISAIRDYSTILGVFDSDPQEFLLALRDSKAERLGLDKEQVKTLLQQRYDARQTKNFAAADSIRKQLFDLGVEVKDTPDGQVWDIK